MKIALEFQAFIENCLRKSPNGAVFYFDELAGLDRRAPRDREARDREDGPFRGRHREGRALLLPPTLSWI